jgi:hypothetical protein
MDRKTKKLALKIGKVAGETLIALAAGVLVNYAEAGTECQATPNGRPCTTEADFPQFDVQAGDWCFCREGAL